MARSVVAYKNAPSFLRTIIGLLRSIISTGTHEILLGQEYVLCPSLEAVAPMPPLKNRTLAYVPPSGRTPVWIMLHRGDPGAAMVRSGSIGDSAPKIATGR